MLEVSNLVTKCLEMYLDCNIVEKGARTVEKRRDEMVVGSGGCGLTGLCGACGGLPAMFPICQGAILGVLLRSVGKSSLHSPNLLIYFSFSLSLLSLWFLFLAPLKEISTM